MPPGRTTPRVTKDTLPDRWESKRRCAGLTEIKKGNRLKNRHQTEGAADGKGGISREAECPTEVEGAEPYGRVRRKDERRQDQAPRAKRPCGCGARPGRSWMRSVSISMVGAVSVVEKRKSEELYFILRNVFSGCNRVNRLWERVSEGGRTACVRSGKRAASRLVKAGGLGLMSHNALRHGDFHDAAALDCFSCSARFVLHPA